MAISRRSRKADGPHDPVTAWAKDIVGGRIVAGQTMIAAADRHLRDLKDGPKRGLHWDLEAALHKINWFPSLLTITAGAKAGEPFQLLPVHMFATGSLFGWKRADGRRRFRTCWFETGKGQAKALALDTPIPTPSGWTTMGALEDGDEIFDENGKPCRVLKAHPVLYGHKCYRVGFDDGSSIVADAGHLWRTEMRNSGSAGHGDATRGVPLKQRGGWRIGIRTTEQIAQTLRYKNGRYQSANHSIALAGSLDLTDRPLPIDPYLLGFWLGDGDSDGARVTISSKDIDASREILRGVGAELGPAHGRDANRYSVRIDARYRDGLLTRLRKSGLIRNKHIPGDYLRAAVSQRMALLQGLMDTDGTVSNRQCSFCNTNRDLAEQVHELAISLGLKATFSEKAATLNGVTVGRAYYVVFYAPPGFRVFRLERKQERVAPNHTRRRLSGERRIVSCDEVPSVPVKCITASSASRLYLAGRSMVPTHNTPWMAAVALCLMRFEGISRFEGYAVAGTENQSGIALAEAAALCRSKVPTDPDGRTLEELAGYQLRGTGDLTWQIEWDGREHGLGISKFRNVSTTGSISGPKPYIVVADEIHEWDDPAILEMWTAALMKMPGDPLMLLGTNTPAQDQLIGTEQSDYYTAVAKGDVIDDASLALVATCDEKDDPVNDETVWRKALPALDITYPSENIRDELNKAKGLPSRLDTIKRLYFGLRIGVADAWIDLPTWQSVVGHLDEEELKGLPCWLGLDLSSRKDLTALAAVWRRPDDHLLARIFYWTPGETLIARSKEDRAPYDQWVKAEHLVATPGATIPKLWPATQTARMVDEYDVQAMAYDPAQILDFEESCAEIGLDIWRYQGPDEPVGDGLMMIQHGQGWKGMDNPKMLAMPASVKAFEDHILNRRITIELNPVTTFCSGNMVLVGGANPDQRVPTRRKSRGRIDGMVAVIEAVGGTTKQIGEGSGMDDFLANPVRSR